MNSCELCEEFSRPPVAYPHSLFMKCECTHTPPPKKIFMFFMFYTAKSLLPLDPSLTCREKSSTFCKMWSRICLVLLAFVHILPISLLHISQNVDQHSPYFIGDKEGLAYFPRPHFAKCGQTTATLFYSHPP